MSKFIKSATAHITEGEHEWGGVDMSKLNYTIVIDRKECFGFWLHMYADRGLLSPNFTDWVRENIAPDQRHVEYKVWKYIIDQFNRAAMFYDIDTVRNLENIVSYRDYDALEPVAPCGCRAGKDGIGCINGIYWLPGYEHGVTCARCKGKGYMGKADNVAHYFYLALRNPASKLYGISEPHKDRMLQYVSMIMDGIAHGDIDADSIERELEAVNTNGERRKRGQMSMLDAINRAKNNNGGLFD